MTAALLAPPDVVDDVRRREFLGILAAAGLLVGCGSPEAGSGDRARGATRQVTDRAGREVEIPVDPRRVVVLDPARASVDATALGVVPIGATTSVANPGGEFAPILGPAAKTIADVGETGAADLEQVAALEPDLILFATVYQEGLSIDTLSAIAPVIAYDRPQFGIAEPLRFFGEVLNRKAEAAQLEAEYDDLVATRRAELGLEGRTVAVLNLPVGAATEVEILGPNAGFHPVLARLGAEHSPSDFAAEDFNPISLELLSDALAGADFVIGLRFAIEGQGDADAFTSSPVWQSVPAVARGDFAYLDGQNAFGNYGLGGVEAAIDELATQLS